MALIAQKNIFYWEDVDASSDLDRVQFVLDVLPDEKLMRTLEKERGQGRNDYPVRAVFNSVIAGIVFQHDSVESLRRELSRNGELRQLCGFNPLLGGEAVPPPSVYTRFLQRLVKEKGLVDDIASELIRKLTIELPDLGKRLAGDSKAIHSAGKPTEKDPDGRRDTDADYGKKEYKGKRKDGSVWAKVVSWFGYKVHLIVDSTYELPLAWEVSRASKNDSPYVLPMMEKLAETHPDIVERSDVLTADRGYDSEKNNRELYDTYGIKPLIDIRHDWKDGETTRALYPDILDCLVYDEDGRILCVAPSAADARKNVIQPLVFDGFEADRMSLKYRCPAAVHGCECPNRDQCGASAYGRVVRVPLALDRRHFVPIPRQSATWERLYKDRTAVERVNSRLDVSFGFERHYIRGKAKMSMRIDLAMIVMLAMALGSIKAGLHDRMRSLVQPVSISRGI